MPSLLEEYGALVRSHRDQRNMTQTELADRCGRSLELIGRIERGAAAPSFETIEAIATALQIPVRDFFGSGPHAVGTDDAMGRVIVRLSRLSPADLAWAERLLETALTRRDESGSTGE